jgi:hypothetical protein
MRCCIWLSPVNNHMATIVSALGTPLAWGRLRGVRAQAGLERIESF